MTALVSFNKLLNILGLEQIKQHFFQKTFSDAFSLKNKIFRFLLFHMGQIDNKSTLLLAMAWQQKAGDAISGINDDPTYWCI